MNPLIENNKKSREETLKQIIRDLHAGVPVEKLQKTFAKLIKNTSPDEIAQMENALIQEGFPPEEIQRLCDVHAQVFEKSLKRVGKTSKIPGHPVHTFVQENNEAKKRLKDLSKLGKKLYRGKFEPEDVRGLRSKFERLKEIEKHYQRKENQLFPVLESKKFTGPTQVMWGKHDEIRAQMRKVDSTIEEQDWSQLFGQLKGLSSVIKKMIFLEEKILYPTAYKMLNEEEWAEIKQGEPEIGYAWVKPSNLWDANLAKRNVKQSLGKKREGEMKKEDEKMIRLSQGQLSAEQIDLLLKHLPVDITFVDENDRVCYYSDTRDRIFPRSPAIIGRAVKNCHPPKSVHIVEDIVKNFKEKKKEKAEFWIQMDGRFIYIRYFPVYDEKGEYRGIIEVSQEISNIKILEGERRLLDW